VTGRQAANGHAEHFDLDAAVRAAQGEAEAVPFRFTYGGEDYEIPAPATWPLTAMSVLSSGDLPRALAQLLGPDQFARLEASGITLGGINALFEAVGQASGLGGLPNSSAQPQPASTRT